MQRIAPGEFPKKVDELWAKPAELSGHALDQSLLEQAQAMKREKDREAFLAAHGKTKTILREIDK